MKKGQPEATLFHLDEIRMKDDNKDISKHLEEKRRPSCRKEQV
jgi:hypothetical protein